MTRLRIATALSVAVLATLAGAVAARADSIVFVKDGDVWLTSPDGAKRYQVTFDGGYASPSQADDGTIVALRDKHFVRMDRTGRRLNAPVAGIGTPPVPGNDLYGPYEPKVSPDGRRIAYYFGQYTSFYDPGCYCERFRLGDRVTWTASDHFTDYADDGSYKGLIQPSWITNDRVLATYPMFSMNVWTWKLDSGHPQYDAQSWFGTHLPEEYGYYDFGDAELSPDGSKLAVTAGGDVTTNTQLFLLTTNGPAWAGEPPYDNFDSSAATPAEPTLRCGGELGSAVLDPTWSPSSDALAFSQGDGVHVDAIPADVTASCAGVSDRVIAPGGTEPDWGPADVDLAQKPAPPTPGPKPGPTPEPGPQPSRAPRITKLTLSPAIFRAARSGASIATTPGTTVRFTASAPARVTLRVQRVCAKAARRCAAVPGSIATAARPGANRWRFRGRIAGRTLTPGRYRLTFTTTGLTGRRATTVAAGFRIVR